MYTETLSHLNFFFLIEVFKWVLSRLRCLFFLFCFPLLFFLFCSAFPPFDFSFVYFFFLSFCLVFFFNFSTSVVFTDRRFSFAFFLFPFGSPVDITYQLAVDG